MSISRIKQIKNIIYNSDVRDPRATLIAIEEVLSQDKPAPAPKAWSGKRIIKITGHRAGDRVGVTIRSDNSLSEAQLLGVVAALQKHREIKFGPVAKKCDFSELFKHFEADAIKATGITQGGAK